MRRVRGIHVAVTFALLGAVAGLAACGDSDDSTATTAPPETLAPETAPPETVAPETSEVEGLAQPAIWPAAGTVFATPEEAAEDFMATVFGVTPVLGEFMGGDSRSGEIEVFAPGESGPLTRSLLYLRQLAPGDGWFVIGAVELGGNVTITSPATNDEVAAGELTVTGVGRGFETTVVVRAFIAGDADAVIDEVIAAGGALETPEPYSVTLDLSGAAPGDMVTILVRGDTGLSDDPGEFAAIPVVIAAG